MKRFALLGIVAALVVGGAACSSTPEPPGNHVRDELAGAPDWVRKGCVAFWDDEDDRKICGVGSAGGTRNAGLARSGAVARARTEIARTLQVQVESMLKDYQATTTGGQDFGNAAADDQHLVDVGRQITDMTLSGTEMIDSWISDSGTFYAIVALDTERFKDAVSKMQNLSDSVRRAVIERADEAFRDLDEQLDKRRER
ncbi:LPP20 family lipoprotein [Vulgatibacter sp.]|uniref:LPP20 family lipoprotein n=1 Tax=Vulgatibacter sp. TaxID=1971226 RepID=UPI00356941D8